MSLGEQSGSGGPMFSDPSKWITMNLSSTGDVSTQLEMDPISGQSITFTTLYFLDADQGHVELCPFIQLQKLGVVGA